MCIAKGVFVLASLLLAVLGSLFVMLSAYANSERYIFLFLGCAGITLSIVGLFVLQESVGCGASFYPYA